MVKVKNIIIWTMIVALVLLSGCGKENYPDLPDDAIAFRMSSFEDKEHDDGVDLMPPPKTFYRAIDTKEKDIEIPEYIDARGYDYWK